MPLMLLMIIITFIYFIIDEVHAQCVNIDHGGEGGKYHNVDDSGRPRRRYFQEAKVKREVPKPKEGAGG